MKQRHSLARKAFKNLVLLFSEPYGISKNVACNELCNVTANQHSNYALGSGASVTNSTAIAFGWAVPE